jgi:hypothetical protein
VELFTFECEEFRDSWSSLWKEMLFIGFKFVANKKIHLGRTFLDMMLVGMKIWEALRLKKLGRYQTEGTMHSLML